MRHVLRFDDPIEAESPESLVGQKGAGLREIARLGIPVPPGFTLTTEVFRRFVEHGGLPDEVMDEVRAALRDLERRLGRTFGGAESPLLVSVRSGAPASMPGMLDTVLNLGLNDRTVEALALETGDRRFALDTYRRFLGMFGTVVMKVARSELEAPLVQAKIELGRPRALDAELDVDVLAKVVTETQRVLARAAGTELPQDPEQQLALAIGAVFRSWDNPRAIRYRKMQGIASDLGTACTVQAMVFGNRGPDSGSGVAFSRHPSTGEPAIHGEFLAHAQGEDVVSGTRTPASLTAATSAPGTEDQSLERRLPEAYRALARFADRLERHFGDLQDIEFTIERGQPYVLQTRTGKRSARAAVRIAFDMVREGIVDADSALLQIDAASLDQLFRARLPAPEELASRGVLPIARGLPASPGAATGVIVLDAEEAVRRAGEGQDVVLVRRDTSPEDVYGMRASVGVLTTAGGMTSHAAVVARGIGRSCVVGASTIAVDYQKGTVAFRPRGAEPLELRAGDRITVDGASGSVYLGSIPAIAEPAMSELDSIMRWADDRRRLGVRAVVDSVPRALAALEAGAEGIGLYSSDGLVLAGDGLHAFRALLFDDPEDAGRHEQVLEDALVPGFAQRLGAAGTRPVVIRLFDDVLRKVNPTSDEAISDLAARTHGSIREIARRARTLTEQRPGLGFRGVRLGLAVPGLYRAEVRAIARAAAALTESGAARPSVEIAVPAVSTGREFGAALSLVRETLRHRDVAGPYHRDIPVGAVVGVPHACLDAAEIASLSEFLVFDTHELTQAVFVMSREDTNMYLSRYIHELQVFDADPFVRFDDTGVGKLVRMGAEQARRAHPGIRLEVAGEVAGEPAACQLAEDFGMDAVACPTNRLAVARLGAAQARIHAHRQGRPDAGDSGPPAHGTA